MNLTDAGLDLADLLPAVWVELVASNFPERLFIFGGSPVRLRPGANGQPVIEPLSVERLRHELAHSDVRFERRRAEHMGFVQFYRQRIAPNDLVARVLANQWADMQGI